MSKGVPIICAECDTSCGRMGRIRMVGIVADRSSRICANGDAFAVFGGQTSVAFSTAKKIDFSGLRTCT